MGEQLDDAPPGAVGDRAEGVITYCGARHAASVKLLSLPVSDQEAAKRFYVEQVGMELLADDRWGDDQRWVRVGFPGEQTNLSSASRLPSSVTGPPTSEPLRAQGLAEDGAAQRCGRAGVGPSLPGSSGRGGGGAERRFRPAAVTRCLRPAPWEGDPLN
ncbi:VOC family protein [Streptomyces sp. NBC_00453]|uniref:VOC family protein n=1 Tax=Streptomyces sp. NBC_00453 TaxID=2903653 RepID=UPI002E22DE58